MSEKELLSAISVMLDEKLNVENKRFDSIEKRLHTLEDGFLTLTNEVRKINITLENEIRPNIKILTEVFLPAANEYEEAYSDIENLKTDVGMLKNVVSEHSEILENI